MGGLSGIAGAEAKVASKTAAKTATKSAATSEATSAATSESSFSSSMNQVKGKKSSYGEGLGNINQTEDWVKEFEQGQEELHVDENISKNLAQDQIREQEEIAKMQKELNAKNSTSSSATFNSSNSSNSPKEEPRVEKPKKTDSSDSSLFSSNSNSSSPDSSNAEQMAQDAKEKREEAQQEQEERKEQVAQQTAELERKKEDAIAKVEAWRDEKIQKIKAGPTGIIKWYTSKTALIISGAIDSGFGLIPIAGDFFGLFFNLVFWIIPFVLSGEFSAYLKVVGFYIVDLIVGLVGGTLADILPAVGDALVDAIPEVVVMTAMQKHAPYNILEATYQERIPHMINDVDKRAKKKIEAIRKSTSSKELALRKTLSGKRSLRPHISLDGQKMITFVFSMLILLMGPVGSFLPIQLPLLSFDSASLVIVGLTSVFLLLFGAFGFVNKKHMLGLFIFMGLNALAVFMLSQTQFLSQYLGNNTVIAMLLFLVGGALYVANLEEWLSPKQTGTIVIVLAFLLVTPFMFSYVGSERFTHDVQKGQVQAQADIQNGNWVQQFVDWFTMQKKMGSGNYIRNGENEQTAEFMGVSIEGIEPLQNSYHVGQPARIDIDYSANSYNDITIMTECSVPLSGSDNFVSGTVEPKFADASLAKSSRVKCIFNDLPEGYYTPQIKTTYSYTSTTEIPITYMDENYAQKLLYNSKTSGGKTPEEVVGASDDKVITDAGPIYIAASNARKDGVNVLQNPIIISREHPNAYPTPLKIQFPNVNDAQVNGGIDAVKSVKLTMPAGLEVQNCNFAPGKKLDHTVDSSGRWIVDVKDAFTNSIESYKTIACDLTIADGAVDNFIPEGISPWQKRVIGVVVDYNYKIEKTGDLFQIS